ncbi:universal stress protein [Halobacteriaceae archaeon SHR40]|uniref:universal stress protein n=1 Tax=Halovenus amylolytica TaxID=2500550 RepID=UPI000FE34A68
MYNDILVPTDGRAGTEAAIVRALDLARAFDATIHALYVVDTRLESAEIPAEDHEEIREQIMEQGHAATVEIQDRADEIGVDVVREIREGVPEPAILDYVSEEGMDVVVMGTRGRTEPQTHHLGSTTQRVLTRAPVPVLTVALGETGPLPESGYGMYDEIVIPTDGSDVAERAAEQAVTIAARYGADIRVVYVVDTTTYGFEDTPRSIVGILKQGGQNAVETIAEMARERNLPVTTSILRGVPEDEILQYVSGSEADLVAMGTRGVSAVDDHFLGSTTARVVRRSSVPVLTMG